MPEKNQWEHITSESVSAEYSTSLYFDKQDDFRVGAKNDLVLALNLSTSGKLYGSKLYIEQTLIGSAHADDSARGLNGSVALAYEIRRQCAEAQLSEAAPYVEREHKQVIDIIRRAFAKREKLPLVIASLKLIESSKSHAL